MQLLVCPAKSQKSFRARSALENINRRGKDRARISLEKTKDSRDAVAVDACDSVAGAAELAQGVKSRTGGQEAQSYHDLDLQGPRARVRQGGRREHELASGVMPGLGVVDDELEPLRADAKAPPEASGVERAGMPHSRVYPHLPPHSVVERRALDTLARAFPLLGRRLHLVVVILIVSVVFERDRLPDHRSEAHPS